MAKGDKSKEKAAEARRRIVASLERSFKVMKDPGPIHKNRMLLESWLRMDKVEREMEERIRALLSHIEEASCAPL